MVNDIIDGKYEILSKIGSGGTSIVYKARRLSDGFIVAIKVVRDELEDIDEHERHFRHEAEALAKMSQPQCAQNSGGRAVERFPVYGNGIY